MDWMDGRNAVNLVMAKMERVNPGDKDRGETESEIRKVTGMAAAARTINSLGKKYGGFGGWQQEKWYC
jgi:hypothetical protein